MMSTLEELKKMWQQKENAAGDQDFTEASLGKIIRARVKRHTKSSLN